MMHKVVKKNKNGEFRTILVDTRKGVEGKTYRITVFVMSDEFAKENHLESPVRELLVSEFDRVKREWTPLIVAGDVADEDVERWMKEDTILENVSNLLGRYFALSPEDADFALDKLYEKDEPAEEDESSKVDENEFPF